MLNSAYGVGSHAMQIEQYKLQEFWNMWYAGKFPFLRIGQAFHSHFQLDKCTQDKYMLDRLYELDGQKAVDFIIVNFSLS